MVTGTVKQFHIMRTVQEEQKWKQLKQNVIDKKSLENEDDTETTKPIKKSKGLLERL